MGIEAKTNQYWVASNALNITLNTQGDPNRIQCSVASGAVISCYVEDVKPESAGPEYAGNGDGLLLDNSRNPKRWPLSISPTYFNDDSAKYVYVAIPRSVTVGSLAVVVFPSEHLDIFGKNNNGSQVGSSDYFYVWLQGIISEPVLTEGVYRRSMISENNYGTLGTYEDIIDMSETEWYQYHKTGDYVTFLKEIEMNQSSKFRNLKATRADITSEIDFGTGVYHGELTGVATDDNTSYIPDNSIEHIVTPAYLDKITKANFLSKVADDEAEGKIGFLSGIGLGIKSGADYPYKIDEDGAAKLMMIVVSKLLRSEQFIDGLAGAGWQLWLDDDNNANLSLDRLTVRNTMVLFELLVEKIRSVCGSIVVSAANGKIKTVDETSNSYIITFEQDNTFEAHDLVRCQRFTGGSLKSYWVEVYAVEGNSIVIQKSEFDGSTPEVGDDCVLMGNTQNSRRQNFISISATEDGQPRIDVMDNVSSKSLSGCLRTRSGNLDGIIDNYFADEQPQGNGLFSDNAYLKGKFLLETGEDVKTKFEISEGKFSSIINSFLQDSTDNIGYISNPCFTEGFSYWNTSNTASFFKIGDDYILTDGKMLSSFSSGALVTTDLGRNVVLLRNSYIMQKASDMHNIPQMNGLPEKVYLSFFYRCVSSGTLTASFQRCTMVIGNTFTPMNVQESITPGDGYKQFTCDGQWNGTGNFKIEFTGEIYIYMVVLSFEKVAHEYRTFFLQSDKLINIAAENFDNNGEVLSTSGIMVKATGSGIYAHDASGNEAMVGVYASVPDGSGGTKSVVKLTGDDIILEGELTANGNVKIRQNGSIEAVNGTFKGEIEAQSGKIADVFYINHSYISSVQNAQSAPNNGFWLSTTDLTVQNSSESRFVSVGTLTFSGGKALQILEDTKTNETNIATRYNVQNGKHNFAFIGNGNGLLNGLIDGWGFQSIILPTSNNNIIDLVINNSNKILVRSTTSGTGVILPTLTSLRSSIGASSSDLFAFRLQIIGDLGSSNFKIYGRNTIPDGNNQTPLDTDEYPLITNTNGGEWPYIEFAQGDTVEFLMVYDSSRTPSDTIDGFPINYTARVLNLQQ